MTHKGKRRLVIFLCAAAVILVAAGIVRVKLHPPRPLHEQIADYMYHSRTDPKLEYLIEKYGDEFVATEYGSIQSTRFPGLYVRLRWSEEAQTYTDNYIVYLRREDLRAILAPTVQEIYDDCKVFIAPYTPSPDFDKNTTAEELLTTFGMGRNPVVSLWIYTKDDTVGKDTDMQQLTSKIQAMGYSVDVGVYYLSIVDINNGNRFETYTIAGERGSGMICLNGAAARCVQTGDKIIIMCYAQMTPEEVKKNPPKVVFVDEDNKISRVARYEKHGKL